MASHRRFAERLGGVLFPMLSDDGAKVIELYGVLNDRGTGARRSVFVLDKDGRVIHANRQYSMAVPEHYEAVLEALRRS